MNYSQRFVLIDLIVCVIAFWAYPVRCDFAVAMVVTMITVPIAYGMGAIWKEIKALDESNDRIAKLWDEADEETRRKIEKHFL